MGSAQAAVPRDPNDCGYKLTFAKRSEARMHIKQTLQGCVPYCCTVCEQWHIRGKGDKPKNAPEPEKRHDMGKLKRSPHHADIVDVMRFVNTSGGVTEEMSRAIYGRAKQALDRRRKGYVAKADLSVIMGKELAQKFVDRTERAM